MFDFSNPLSHLVRCIPMLFFISGVAMSTSLSSHLKKLQMKQLFHPWNGGIADSSRSRTMRNVTAHCRFLISSTWRLLLLIMVGLAVNLIQVSQFHH